MDITFDLIDGVGLIKMDDGKKNAINHDALAQLEDAFDRAQSDAKAIVFAGRPGAFCAGFDISVMTGGDEKAATELGDRGGRLALRLFGLPIPLVCACTGHAFTIGAVWMAACDTRLGTRGDYKFGMTETALGRVLPSWALEPMSARLSPAAYIPAIVQSKIYGPEDAVTAGFIDELVEEGKTIDAAIELAGALSQLPAAAYAGNKLARRKDALKVMQADLVTA